MLRLTRRTWPLLVLSAVVVGACSTGSDAPRVPLGRAAIADSTLSESAAHAMIGPAAQAALDRGNDLFRKKAFSPALTAYREAADLAPQHAAPLFGIYMVARATNNTPLADSALAGIRRRSSGTPVLPHAMNDSAPRAPHPPLARNKVE